MDFLASQGLWIAAAVAAVVGFGIGIAVGRSGSRQIARVRELEEQLHFAEEEMGRYRTQVSAHFGETSKLLRDLTLQYRNVYEHLADGARTLCPGSTPLLAPSLAEAARPASAEPHFAADEPDDQLDLDLDAARPAAWSAEAPGEEALEIDDLEEADRARRSAGAGAPV